MESPMSLPYCNPIDDLIDWMHPELALSAKGLSSVACRNHGKDRLLAPTMHHLPKLYQGDQDLCDDMGYIPQGYEFYDHHKGAPEKI